MSENRYGAKHIINLGLGKIGSTQISTYDAPKSSIEKFVADGYPHWRDTELEKRRWVFATEVEQLTLGAQLGDEFGPNVNVYDLPNNLLRPIRQSRSTWTVRGRKLYSDNAEQFIEYIARRDEQDFPPSFVEVLACRVAVECCEFITQSNTKKADAHSLYKDALLDAGRQNAFILGNEDTTTPDELSEWTASRWG